MIAFLGNSILYFNDCPRLVAQMLGTEQDSCLRGGATLTTLWEKGNGMQDKFGEDFGAASPKDLLEQRTWEFVVMNDYTKHPARRETRDETIKTLQRHYLPLLSPDTTLIFVQTAPYKHVGMRGSEDLGMDFARLLLEGYHEYKTVVEAAGVPCRIAPFGLAVESLRDTRYWDTLFAPDDFHPSAHGTWLEACTICCAITGQEPPRYHDHWWESSRYRQPPEQDLCRTPTSSEAEELRQVAIRVCRNEGLLTGNSNL